MTTEIYRPTFQDVLAGRELTKAETALLAACRRQTIAALHEGPRALRVAVEERMGEGVS